MRLLQVISFLTLIEWEICLYPCIIFQCILAVPVDFIFNDVIKNVFFSHHSYTTRRSTI